jgi:hypothetical protein
MAVTARLSFLAAALALLAFRADAVNVAQHTGTAVKLTPVNAGTTLFGETVVRLRHLGRFGLPS